MQQPKEIPIRIAFWLVQDSIHHWSNWIAGLYYVCHCLEALAILPDADRPSVVAFVPETLITKFRESFDYTHAAWIEVVPVAVSETGTINQEELAQLVASKKCDLLFPAITPPCIPFSGKVIAWITDYQHKYYPEFFSPSECSFRDQLFSFMTAISSTIVCSSEAVRQDLARFYPAAADRARVLRFTTLPPPGSIKADLKRTLKRLGVTSPYAYLPYQFWKHKNHRTVFRAWEKLAARGLRYQLVCTGATNDSRSPEHFPELMAYLEQAGLTDSVRILGMVAREDQWQLYRGAKLILQPSLFEGWSTSVEEARSLGKPVFLSDIPVHREQLSETGYFFESTNPDSLADLIASNWQKLPNGLDSDLELEASENNLARLKAFGIQLLAIFQETIEDPKASVAADVLPLFLYFQREANERLKILNQMQQHIEYLNGLIANNANAIHPEEVDRETIVFHQNIQRKPDVTHKRSFWPWPKKKS